MGCVEGTRPHHAGVCMDNFRRSNGEERQAAEEESGVWPQRTPGRTAAPSRARRYSAVGGWNGVPEVAQGGLRERHGGGEAEGHRVPREAARRSERRQLERRAGAARGGEATCGRPASWAPWQGPLPWRKLTGKLHMPSHTAPVSSACSPQPALLRLLSSFALLSACSPPPALLRLHSSPPALLGLLSSACTPLRLLSSTCSPPPARLRLPFSACSFSQPLAVVAPPSLVGTSTSHSSQAQGPRQGKAPAASSPVSSTCFRTRPQSQAMANPGELSSACSPPPALLLRLLSSACSPRPALLSACSPIRLLSSACSPPPALLCLLPFAATCRRGAAFCRGHFDLALGDALRTNVRRNPTQDSRRRGPQRL